ncbi:hypothetical protein HK096_010567, partial [Nowakowskiella sp. JEL0078]
MYQKVSCRVSLIHSQPISDIISRSVTPNSLEETSSVSSIENSPKQKNVFPEIVNNPVLQNVGKLKDVFFLIDDEIRKSNDVKDNIEQLRQTLVEISKTNLISQAIGNIPPAAIPSTIPTNQTAQKSPVVAAVAAPSSTATVVASSTSQPQHEPLQQQKTQLSSAQTLTASSVEAYQQQQLQQQSAASLAAAKAAVETAKKQLEEARLESKKWRDSYNDLMKLKESSEEKEKRVSGEKLQLEEAARIEAAKSKDLEIRIRDLESARASEREKEKIRWEEEVLRLGEAIEAREESERQKIELRLTISELELANSQLQEPISELKAHVENLKLSLAKEQGTVKALKSSLEFTKERESDLLSLCGQKEAELNAIREELIVEKERLAEWIELEEERKKLEIENKEQEELMKAEEEKSLDKDSGIKPRKNKVTFSEPL